jgi:hypothetical protein
MSDSLRIYDLPASQGQVHLHGDATGTNLYGGRLYDYSRQAYRPLNGYEAAMADYSAQQVGLPKIER